MYIACTACKLLASIGDAKRADQRRPRRRASAPESASGAVWAVSERIPPGPRYRSRAHTYGARVGRTNSRAWRVRRTLRGPRCPRGARPSLIVVDASVLTDFLVGRTKAIDAVEEVVAGRAGEALYAPDLI